MHFTGGTVFRVVGASPSSVSSTELSVELFSDLWALMVGTGAVNSMSMLTVTCADDMLSETL